MNIKDIMNKLNIKTIDEDYNWAIFKVGSQMHIFYLESNSNQFIMERDLYEYLDSNSLPYSLLLFNKKSKQYFYIDLKKGHNWIKACFDNCAKESIFLGKQIMNYPIREDEIVDLFKKLK